jgi:hypothetical protein
LREIPEVVVSWRLLTQQVEVDMYVSEGVRHIPFLYIFLVILRAFESWWQEKMLATKAPSHQPACRRQGLHKGFTVKINFKLLLLKLLQFVLHLKEICCAPVSDLPCRKIKNKYC